VSCELLSFIGTECCFEISPMLLLLSGTRAHTLFLQCSLRMLVDQNQIGRDRHLVAGSKLWCKGLAKFPKHCNTADKLGNVRISTIPTEFFPSTTACRTYPISSVSISSRNWERMLRCLEQESSIARVYFD
jgi:hypothetical protein